MKLKSKKNLPAFPFVIDLMQGLDYQIKPMFGCHAIYIGEKIVIILRNKDNHEEANGVWIATDFEHHASLKKLFKGLTRVAILTNGDKETAWQMISNTNELFEEQTTKLCELIRKNDPRIGRIPKRKSAGK